MEVSWIAVIAAAVSAFVLGGIWYGPLFGQKWMAYNGITEEQAKSANMAKVFGGAFVLSLIAAFVFAMFLGPEPGLQFAAAAGFAAGLAGSRRHSASTTCSRSGLWACGSSTVGTRPSSSRSTG